MLAKIGKIKKYDNGVGEIVTENDQYLFTFEDIDDGEQYEVNDIVIFRGEKEDKINRAFFVKKYNKETEEIYKKLLQKEQQ